MTPEVDWEHGIYKGVVVEYTLKKGKHFQLMLCNLTVSSVALIYGQFLFATKFKYIPMYFKPFFEPFLKTLDIALKEDL